MFFASAIFAASVITNAVDLNAAVADETERKFDLQGMITYLIAPGQKSFLFKDASGFTAIDSIDSATHGQQFAVGDIVRATGRVFNDRRGFSVPLCTSLVRIGHEPPPPPAKATVADVKSGKIVNQPVQIKGVVRDIFQDDIDPAYHFFILAQGSDSIYVSLHTANMPPKFPETLVNSEVMVFGYSHSLTSSSRALLVHTIHFCADSVEILCPAPRDPFDVPDVERHPPKNPETLMQTGRQKVRGRVRALWRGREVLVADYRGDVHDVNIPNGLMPRCGDLIEAVGLPATDLYRINLYNAKWRAMPAGTVWPTNSADVVRTTAAEILVDGRGNQKIKPKYHGMTISLHGKIQNIPSAQNRSTMILLRCDDFIIPMDITSCPRLAEILEEGDDVDATGCCIIESENWKSYSTFPRTTGVILSINSENDILVLARPPWWTPTRLRTAIGALMFVLVTILIWNFLLRRAVERRGSALEKEITSRIVSDLKVYERTRLAVDLHDSIAQNLTGISLEIDAAYGFAMENPNEMMRHLSIASSALRSCRDELRNCLWDLRNQSLEDESMDTAIRRTLTPHLSGAELSVRFNVPRERLPDNVAHAILRIIRELTINAVRHGHAKCIKVAGCLDTDHLLFSVKDNGCGFDPDNRLGVEEGHYGLQGVIERADDLDGDMAIESEPGRGTKVTIRINATPNTKKTNEQ